MFIVMSSTYHFVAFTNPVNMNVTHWHTFNDTCLIGYNWPYFLHIFFITLISHIDTQTHTFSGQGHTLSLWSTLVWAISWLRCIRQVVLLFSERERERDMDVKNKINCIMLEGQDREYLWRYKLELCKDTTIRSVSLYVPQDCGFICSKCKDIASGSVYIH